MSDPVDSIYHWLESAGLERYYERFCVHGITEDTFTRLNFADYDAMGITDKEERQRLFRLIQVVKREMESNPAPASGGGAATPASRIKRQSSAEALVSTPAPSAAAGDAGSRARTPATGLKTPSVVSGSNSSGVPAQERKAGGNLSVGSGLGGGVGGGTPLPNSARGVSVERSSSPPPSAAQQAAASAALDFGESKIRVVIRKRPLSKKEEKNGEKDIVQVPSRSTMVYVHEPKQKVDLTKYIEKHRFCFDRAFDDNASNQEIYQVICKPLVDFFFNRGKATCFAYGQTGSGKTFTMMGPGGGQGQQSGLYALAAEDIFKQIRAYPNLDFTVSFYEIYGGKLFDLLNERKRLVSREDAAANVNIVGLRETPVENVEQLLQLITDGNTVRSTGQTGANVDSSRSHAVLQMCLYEVDRKRPGKRGQPYGKFSFIDLAGSERGADTMTNDRRTRIEGAEINKSLLALKECIRALDQDAKHLPFRGSKLTQVLKDSFVGNSRTIMVANVSPNSGAVEHTLNTLRYADRVKELKKDGPSSGIDAYMPHQGNRQNVELGSISDEENGYSDHEDFLTPMTPHREPARSVAPANNEPRSVQQKEAGVEDQPPSHSKPSHHAHSHHVHSRQPHHHSDNSSSSAAEDKPVKRPAPVASRAVAHSVDSNADPHSPIDSLASLEEQERLQQQDLLRTHEQICSAILEEEDQIVEAHRQQIDESMKLVKEEMQLLKKFDQLAFSVDEYVDQLDHILADKIKTISDLRARISVFKAHLREEELLSSSLKGGALNLLPEHVNFDNDM